MRKGKKGGGRQERRDEMKRKKKQDRKRLGWERVVVKDLCSSQWIWLFERRSSYVPMQKGEKELSMYY